MRTSRFFIAMIAVLALSPVSRSGDDAAAVKKSAERSTLNQPGTTPFHLKANIAPSHDRDQGSNRTGEIEIWWASPTQYRREVRSPGFHQIDVVNGGREWQKNEGDYFPEWLREMAVELIEPIPSLNQVLEMVKVAEVKKLAGSTYYSWTISSTDGQGETQMDASVAITDATGLLFYDGGFGWGALFHDYQSFHGRMVARTVSAGTPEVTAKVTVLEDLKGFPAGFFDADAAGGDSPPLHTAILAEVDSRKNLLPMEPVSWPQIKDGPLNGAVTAEIAVDRTGRVRDVGSVVSDNQEINEAARAAFSAMHFTPYLQNGAAVQVLSRMSLHFNTVRPAGVETFESASAYFDRGRRNGFPAAANGPAYILKAEIHAKASNGSAAVGSYVDTWLSQTEWRRELSIGKNRCIRARHGEQYYEWMQGPDLKFCRFVMRAIEPIPASGTFIESDWKFKRELVGNTQTIRVLTGYESPEGVLDPSRARAYWFDESGKLVKTYFIGLETQRFELEDFGGVSVAHLIKVFSKGALAMEIRVTEVSPAVNVPESFFDLSGHESPHTFTDEVR